LNTGHDLRALLFHVRNLGLFTVPGAVGVEIDEQVERVARLWFNNMRFASSKFVETRWYNLGEVRKGRSFKQAVDLFLRRRAPITSAFSQFMFNSVNA